MLQNIDLKTKMATGGGDENSNPFSYSNFVKNKGFSKKDNKDNKENNRNTPVMRPDLVDDEKSSVHHGKLRAISYPIIQKNFQFTI